MEISSNINQNISENIQSISKKKSVEVKTFFTQKISKDEANEIREQVFAKAKEMVEKSMFVQNKTINMDDKIQTSIEEFQKFLKEIDYGGKPIAKLSQEEAAALISEDGIFGIKKTSQRIANFILDTGQNNETLLRAGREGMLQGFEMARQIWGGPLPEISQLTIQKATEIVDLEMAKLGFSILDKEV